MNNTLTITQELSLESIETIRLMITELLHSTLEAKSEADTLFTIGEAAAFLNVSEDSVRVYVRAKYFPSYKKCKKLYFSKQELIEWVKSGPRKPGVRFRAKS